jgi:hypothetical protein
MHVSDNNMHTCVGKAQPTGPNCVWHCTVYTGVFQTVSRDLNGCEE